MSSSGGQLLVLHQGALGDFILTLAVVQAVRESLNPGRVVAIASASSAGLAAGRSAIDSCIHPDSIGLHTLFGGELNQDLRRTIRESMCVLSFLAGPNEPVSRRLLDACSASPECKAMCSTSPERNARGSSCVICVDPRPTSETLTRGTHITQQWADAIRAGGLAIGDPTPPVIRPTSPIGEAGMCATAVSAVPAPIGCTARRAVAHSGAGYVVIHPGSGGRGKCCPVEQFIELASQLRDVRVQWLLGPAELESGVADTVQKYAASARQVVMLNPDLEQAAEAIAGAAAYVGNDAGMTHLAAALGTPTVAIFVSTAPGVWRPLGDHVEVVSPSDTGEAVVDAVHRLTA